MGISGLLPLLKDITTKAHIKEFQGKRAAVDGYVWLYKGSYSCPEELCEGKPTDKCVTRSRHKRGSQLLSQCQRKCLDSIGRNMQYLHV